MKIDRAALTDDLRERAETFFKPENMNRDGKTLIEQLVELLAAIRAEGWNDAATWLWENGGPYEHHAARLLVANNPHRITAHWGHAR